MIGLCDSVNDFSTKGVIKAFKKPTTIEMKMNEMWGQIIVICGFLRYGGKDFF